MMKPKFCEGQLVRVKLSSFPDEAFRVHAIEQKGNQFIYRREIFKNAVGALSCIYLEDELEAVNPDFTPCDPFFWEWMKKKHPIAAGIESV